LLDLLFYYFIKICGIHTNVNSKHKENIMQSKKHSYNFNLISQGTAIRERERERERVNNARRVFILSKNFPISTIFNGAFLRWKKYE